MGVQSCEPFTAVEYFIAYFVTRLQLISSGVSSGKYFKDCFVFIRNELTLTERFIHFIVKSLRIADSCIDDCLFCFRICCCFELFHLFQDRGNCFTTSSTIKPAFDSTNISQRFLCLFLFKLLSFNNLAGVL